MSDDDIIINGTDSPSGDPGEFSFSEPSVTESVRRRQSRANWSLPKYTPLEGLIGDRSARRIWAAECNFLIAAVFAMMMVIALPDFDPLLKGLSFYVFFLLYFQLSEYLAGATPAKWFFGLCVRSADGSKASFIQVAIRTAMRIFELNPIYLGAFPAALFILFTRRHVRLGDQIADTVVTRVENL